MKEYYIIIPKNESNTSKNGNLSLKCFGTIEVHIGMLGKPSDENNSIQFYAIKPILSESGAKNNHLLKVSVEDHENGHSGLRVRGAKELRAGSVRLNLDERLKSPVEPLIIKVEAQILANGKEMTKAAIVGGMENEVSAQMDKEAKSKMNSVLRAASNIKDRIIGKDKSHDTHEDIPRRKM